MALNLQRNLLMDKFSGESREHITRNLSTTDFKIGHVFYEVGDEASSLHFVDSGIISAVSLMDSGIAIEAYMVGREGFVGQTAWSIPSNSAVRYVAQMTGSARKIRASIFREIADADASVRHVMAAHDDALMRELAQSGPCGLVHKTTQRLAKWLLRAHDRADGDTIDMTQEVLSNLLGTQRTTVNEAAQQLAKVGGVKYSRGKLQIVNRPFLERQSCECYDAGRGVYDERRTITKLVDAY